ncbi:MAG TPA: DinB family protein [Mycobacteriales bacterium]|nr:DinB family protein [Mycobacteriales bacterium]
MTEPPLFPDELVAAADERRTSETFLDLYRDIVLAKVEGISEEDARRRLVPSLTTIGGLVKHLRWVEFGWFDRLFADGAGDNRREHDRDWEFRVEPGETLAQFVLDYRAACARSREIAAGRSLEETVPHHRMGQVSLRWIYVHLIEETARHAGHLDILREQIDGRTGD